MLTIHHLGVSQSERVVWLCEELGLDYRLVRYDRDPVTRLGPPDYKALHPLGSAPIITDGDVVLAESGAIVDYILALYGNGGLTIAPGDPAFADYLFWLHFANGSFQPRLMMQLLGGRLGGPEVAAAIAPRVVQAHALIEARLAETPYLAGDVFTVADIMTVFSLTTMRAFTRGTLADYPSIRAYLHRIGERPAYQAAMAKGDPGMTPMLG